MFIPEKKVELLASRLPLNVGWVFLWTGKNSFLCVTSRAERRFQRNRFSTDKRKELLKVGALQSRKGPPSQAVNSLAPGAVPVEFGLSLVRPMQVGP